MTDLWFTGTIKLKGVETMFKTRTSQALAVGVAAGIMAIVLNHVQLAIWWQFCVVAVLVSLVAVIVQAIGRRQG